MGFYRKEESDMLTALLTIAFLEAVTGMAAVFLTKEFALIRILDWTEDKGVIGTAAGLCFAFLLLPYLMAEHTYSCPLSDDVHIDFEKECVGYREKGCKECIYNHAEELR